MTSELNLHTLEHKEGEKPATPYPQTLVDAINDSSSRIAQEIGKGTHLRTAMFAEDGLPMTVVVKRLAPHQHAQAMDAMDRGAVHIFAATDAANWIRDCLVWPPVEDPSCIELLNEMPSVRCLILRAAVDTGNSASEALKKRLSGLFPKRTS